MDTLKYIVDRYKLEIIKGERLPVEIPNIGRDDIPSWLKDLDFKTGVEVGVASGAYSFQLCGSNYQMEWVGVDPWKPYIDYRDYGLKSTFIKMEERAVNRLSSFPNYRFLREWSMDAVKQFEDNSIDFVYIDANHDDPFITQDITEWSKKVRSGGIVSGHDYAQARGANWAVKKAVRKHAEENKIDPWFVLGREGKRRGEIRESSRSWMFIKP